jgi:hypothetical protein
VLDRGFHVDRIGLSMLLHPDEPHFDTTRHHVLADLR